MNPAVNPNHLKAYNDTVREAYFRILKKAKQLLSTLENSDYRHILIRIGKPVNQDESIIHEIINPLIYLRLESRSDDRLHITYGFEQAYNLAAQSCEFTSVTNRFVRYLYKATAKENTEINIEDAVRTDLVQQSCSDLYEYIDERNKYHSYKLIAYKPNAAKRNLMSVA